jgi:AmmeMemoRadiSam system protein A/AmmeMemoRadiSam system protein B
MPHPPIIIPEIGNGEEKKIQKTLDSCKKIAEIVNLLSPNTIIVISPHSQVYSDYFHNSPKKKAYGDLRSFRAGNIKIEAEYDIDYIKELELTAQRAHIPAGTLGEDDSRLDHGVIIPLYFINQMYSDYKLVRLGLSGLSPAKHYSLGRCLAEVSLKTGRKTVIIASGDLSHKLKHDGPYGFAPEGPVFDAALIEALASGDFLTLLSFEEELTSKAAECGLRSFIIMSGALDSYSVESELLSYEGTFGVGYAVAAFTPVAPDDSRAFLDLYQAQQAKKMLSVRENEDDFVKLARLTLESAVRGNKRTPNAKELLKMISDPPLQLTKDRAGVFVSIKKHGALRGCIGTISPVTTSVAEEIVRNAVSAGFEDPRFDRVTEDELNELVYSVDVLSPSEPIDSPDKLDPNLYGVIVSNGYKRGLLLPALEGVDTVEEQLSIALQKAGISKHQPYKLERFEVERHK